MPKNITTVVYTFEELLEGEKQGTITAKAVENAREWLADANREGDWFEYVIDELWEPALEQIGFTNPDIQFTGFWSQGDGASFTASVDLDKLVDFLSQEIQPSECIQGEPEDFRPWVVNKVDGVRWDTKFRRILWVRNDVGLTVDRTSHQYCHQYTCRVSTDFDDKGQFDASKPLEYAWVSDVPHVRKLVDNFFEVVEELRVDLCRAIYRTLEEEYESLRSDESLRDFAEANDYTFTADGKRFG